MFKFRLGSDEAFLILSPRWADLGAAGQVSLLVLVLLVPLGLILWLYRYELRLISGLQACGLLTLRLSILVVIWTAVALQPHFAHVHVEETPSRVRVAVDLSSSMDVADAQRTSDEKRRLASVLRLPDVDALSRKAIASRLLSPQGSNLQQRLMDRHQVELIGFDEQAAELEAARLFEKLGNRLLTELGSPNASPNVVATDLNQPLAKVTSSRDYPLLGVILFSDGRHNVGTPPFAVAEKLGEQRVPIFPVVIGSAQPPNDFMIVDVQAQSKVFKDATMPIEIRCKVVNLPAQTLTVDIQFDDKLVLPEHRHTIKHPGGNAEHKVRFLAKMEQVGTHTLTVKATSKDQKEITLANNQATRIIRVAQDKAKVLLVDGEARWEYHYLATTLARDPTMQLERVVFVQPRIGSVKEPELEKLGNPRTKLPEIKDAKLGDPLMEYDCILLGDVSPEQLPVTDRRRLEKYVSERGGTLILIAGKRHLPMAFTGADDPIAKMLPITEPRVVQPEEGFTLQATAEGKLRPFLQLEPEAAAFAWPELPKHFWGVVGKRKPAASVLLMIKPTTPLPGVNANDEATTGIFLQHNYGYGRVLFVGLDSTWRWRYRVGDAYHHRFWGQLARWSATDKLLPAGNRFIRYGAREPVYNEGQEVELAVRVSETLPPLDEKTPARAKLHRQNANGSEEVVAEIAFAGNTRQRQLLEAKVRDLPAGTYRIELDIPPYREQLAIPSDDEPKDNPKGRDLFRILPREQKEWLDLSTNVTLLQELANKSDGKVYLPEDVEQLLERLIRRIERTEHWQTRKPWEDRAMVWWLLGALIGLLTLEWGWRKWLELP